MYLSVCFKKYLVPHLGGRGDTYSGTPELRSPLGPRKVTVIVKLLSIVYAYIVLNGTLKSGRYIEVAVKRGSTVIIVNEALTRDKRVC